MSVKLINPNREPDPLLIKRLEWILEQAKTGQLRSVAIAGIYQNGDRTRCWFNDNQTFDLAGSISVLHQEFVNCEVE